MSDKLEQAIDAVWMQYICEERRALTTSLENLVEQARDLAVERDELRAKVLKMQKS